MDLLDKLISLAVVCIVYFSMFNYIVTAVATTNWTALGLEWVPTVVYILLAIMPVLGLVAYVKLKKR